MHPHDRPASYEIVVAGHLHPRWRQRLPELACYQQVSASGAPTTQLSGVLVDQAALRGLLNQLWDLGLVILAVTRRGDEDAREQPRGK